MIRRYKGALPQARGALFLAENAEIVGEAVLEEETSVWFAAVLRADIAPIRIGRGSNIQDGVVIHGDADLPTVVGRYVTVGHGAILHSCRVADRCLIGIGAILLGGSSIGPDSIVGAGALVTPGKDFPGRSLILGNPAQRVRELSAKELEDIRKNAEHYIELARSYAKTQHSRDVP